MAVEAPGSDESGVFLCTSPNPSRGITEEMTSARESKYSIRFRIGLLGSPSSVLFVGALDKRGKVCYSSGMNKYRDWTIEFYAGQVPDRVYSAKRHDRRSGETVTLHASNRAGIEREVDSYIQQHDPCQAEAIQLGI